MNEFSDERSDDRTNLIETNLEEYVDEDEEEILKSIDERCCIMCVLITLAVFFSLSFLQSVQYTMKLDARVIIRELGDQYEMVRGG